MICKKWMLLIFKTDRIAWIIHHVTDKNYHHQNIEMERAYCHARPAGFFERFQPGEPHTWRKNPLWRFQIGFSALKWDPFPPSSCIYIWVSFCICISLEFAFAFAFWKNGTSKTQKLCETVSLDPFFWRLTFDQFGKRHEIIKKKDFFFLKERSKKKSHTFLLPSSSDCLCEFLNHIYIYAQETQIL